MTTSGAEGGGEDPGEPSPPEWSRLPHDPVGFFGLDQSFDRKDLKRAYNALIRRFKPEHAPAEFQRIRAAYESLDESLRYGVVIPRQQEDDSRKAAEWTFASEDPQPEPSPATRFVDRTPVPRAKTLLERIETEPLADIYRELAARRPLSPQDHYALALLADLVERDQPMRFVQWLLEGIKAHPDAAPLWRLLHAYLRGSIPAGYEPKLLLAVARVAGDDRFYPLTEPLWIKLLRGGSVAEFQNLLAQCEKQLRDTQIVGRIAFYIQLAKVAVLQDDPSWGLRAIDTIESNFEQVPPWLEPDVDLLGLLRDYVKLRARFVAGSPLRRRIDQALRDYFTQPQEAGDSSVVACQLLIAGDLPALLEAFPLTDNELHSVFYPLWTWVNWDVAERNAAPPKQDRSIEADWSVRVFELVKTISNRASNSWSGICSIASGFVYLAMLVLCYVVPFFGLAVTLTVGLLSIYLEAPSWLFVAIYVLALGIAYVCGSKLSTLMKNRCFVPFSQRISTRIYLRFCRAPLLEFQQRSHLPHNLFRSLFRACVRDDINFSELISDHLDQDYAPAMLALAQRFLA